MRCKVILSNKFQTSRLFKCEFLYEVKHITFRTHRLQGMFITINRRVTNTSTETLWNTHNMEYNYKELH
jgi:hypothetical protein